MTISLAAPAWPLVLLSCALCSCTAPRAITEVPGVLMEPSHSGMALAMFVGDTQERELFGYTTGFSASEAQVSSGVAVRSSEQELFGKYLLGALIDVERPRSATFHLGDFLDYSCESEWASASSALTAEQLQTLFMLPGNHDGLFQGNNHYGPIMRASLAFEGKDATLQGHFSAVCEAGWRDLRGTGVNPEFRKRDFVCAYLLSPGRTALHIPNDIKAACAQAEAARSGKVPESSVAVIHHPNLEPVAGKRANIEQISLSVELSNPSTAQWSSGYMLQAVKLARQPEDAPQVHVLMLDTTDWKAEPEFGVWCLSEANSKCGVIGELQRKAVQAYLDLLPPGSLVLATGHYPIDALHANSREWLLSTLTAYQRAGHNIIYLSAHSHDGAVVTHEALDGVKLIEVNIDSLMDWPVTYWTLTRDDHAYCLEPKEAWQALRCENDISPRVEDISNSAVKYFGDIYSGLLDLGEHQWWLRAKDANRAIRSYAEAEGQVELSCQLESARNSKPDAAKLMHACRRGLDDFIGADGERKRKAACLSIAGAASFAKPALLSRERANYIKVCVPDKRSTQAGDAVSLRSTP